MEERDDVITLTDEEGNEVNFLVVDGTEYNGKTYLMLVEADIADEEGTEAFLLRVEDDGEEDILVTVDDEEEFNAVATVGINFENGVITKYKYTLILTAKVNGQALTVEVHSTVAFDGGMNNEV